MYTYFTKHKLKQKRKNVHTLEEISTHLEFRNFMLILGKRKHNLLKIKWEKINSHMENETKKVKSNKKIDLIYLKSAQSLLIQEYFKHGKQFSFWTYLYFTSNLVFLSFILTQFDE